MRNKRVFITGASGFIGANLVRRLIKERAEVSVLLRDKNSWRLKEVENKIKIYMGNLGDLRSMREIFKKSKPEIIYHLAAYGAYHYQTDVAEIIETIFLGTINLLQTLEEIGTDYQCFVNTGSSSEYGFCGKPMKESQTAMPNSFYAAAKAAATTFCQMQAKRNGRNIITIRPFSAYGQWEEPTRFIPVAIKSILIGESLKLTPAGIRRDFIYIDDVVDGYIKAAAISLPNSDNRIFNLGTGKEYDNKEIVKILEKITGKKANIEYTYQPRNWDQKHWRADIGKSCRTLKWQAKTSLEKGLTKTVEWVRQYYGY